MACEKPQVKSSSQSYIGREIKCSDRLLRKLMLRLYSVAIIKVTFNMNGTCI